MLEKIKSSDLPKKIKELVRKPLFLTAVGLLALMFLTGAGYGIWTTQQPPPQPIQFNHNLHVGFGVQCLYCHPGAWQQASAGIPTSAKCWGCHQQIPIKNADQQTLADAVASGKPIQWVPVFIQPDYVYFNHRPHIAAGLNCENCHGEISRMTVAQPQKGQNMGWCLNCHREKAAGDDEKLAKLIDCATCHR
jgi:hypothetical protein